MGIVVTWKLIQLSLNTSVDQEPLISYDELLIYLQDEMDVISARFADLCLLYCSFPEKEAIQKCLCELIEKENASEELQLRKIRILKLKQVLDTLPDDCFQAHLNLTEFWCSQTDSELICPQQMTTNNSNSNWGDYFFNTSILKENIKKNLAWIKSEILEISHMETN